MSLPEVGISSEIYAQTIAELVMASHASEGNYRHMAGESIADTALLLSLREGILFSADSRQRIFTEYIANTQACDGHWGEDKVSPHSALIDTATVLYLCLSTPQLDSGEINFETGWHALCDLLARSNVEVFPNHETVALEMLAPPLIESIALAREVGTANETNYNPEQRVAITLASLEKQNPNAAKFFLRLKEDQSTKTSLMRQQMGDGRLISPNNTTVHSAESIGYGHRLNYASPLDIATIKELTASSKNGIGNSPAATATAIMFLDNLGLPVPQAHIDYLKSVTSLYGGAAIGVHPFNNTDSLWAGINIVLGNDREVLAYKVIQTAYQKLLASILVDGGVGTTNGFPPDVDDTAIALLYAEQLRAQGLTIRSDLNYTLIQNFVEKGRIVCYAGEMTNSPSHLHHVLTYLDYLLTSPSSSKRPQTEITEITGLYTLALSQLREINGDVFSSLDDKWNGGPGLDYFRQCNSHLMVAQLPELMVATIKKIKDLQLSDGGFGTHLYRKGILEETIYVYLGSLELANKITENSHLQENYAGIITVLAELIQSTSTYIDQRLEANDHGFTDPKTWFAKTTYRTFAMQEGIIASYRLHRFRQLNGLIHPIASQLDNPRSSDPLMGQMIAQTDGLWAMARSLGRGNGYLRAAKAFTSELFAGLDIDLMRATAGSINPPVMNKAMEALAGTGADQILRNLLVQASRNYGDEGVPNINDIFEAGSKFIDLYNVLNMARPEIVQLMVLSTKQIALLGRMGSRALEKSTQRKRWQAAYTDIVKFNYEQEFAKGDIDNTAKSIGIGELEYLENLSKGEYQDLPISSAELFAVEDYLKQFGHTSALGVSIAVAAAHANPNNRDRLISFLDTPDFASIVGISRLVQDINEVDPTERINTGLHYLRIMSGESLGAIKELLTHEYLRVDLAKLSIPGKNGYRDRVSKRLRKVYLEYYLPLVESMIQKYQLETNSPVVTLLNNFLSVNSNLLVAKPTRELI